MSRTNVYVGPRLDPAVGTALGHRDLASLDVADELEAQLNAVAQENCRALVVHVEQPNADVASRTNFEQRFAALSPETSKRGVLLGLVVAGEADDLAFVGQAARLVAPKDGVFNPFLHQPFVIGAAEGYANNVAKRCASHAPGRPWRDVPFTAITREGSPYALGADEKALLQRAFSDCERLEVDVLQVKRHPRHKGRVTYVYRVQPRLPNGPHPIPFIVKTDHPESIDVERGNTERACGEHTPFQYFPPLAPSRYVAGADRAALVSHFVDRAILLERYIASHSPAMAIASLFDGPLRCWRTRPSSSAYRIGRWAISTGVAPGSPSMYTRGHQKAQALGLNPTAPADLLARLRALPARTIHTCRTHGDLHLKNVFVRENSVDTVLIDFARSDVGPASRDPAELEASLAFGDASIPPEILRDLYSTPLLKRSPLPRDAHPRALAIEQVRLQVSGTVSEDEYREMLGAHCLWFARNKGEAYAAADRLIP